ncbi:MAG: hypothetical protein IPI67_14300 [Myxococcales bacterium]|nr:hypothetical protein [Myxococcales bacterium]
MRRGVGLLCLLVVGCGDATQDRDSACPGCPPKGGTPEALPACVTPRVCELPVAIQAEGAIDLAAIAGNVQIGTGFLSQYGPLVPWGSRTCCSGDIQLVAGVALLNDSLSITASGPLPAGAPDNEMPLPIFEREDKVRGVVVDANLDKVVELNLETQEVSAPMPAPIGGTNRVPPAVVGVGRALAALIGPTPRFVLVDQTLSERLVDVPLTDAPATGLTLTRTCSGLVATWLTSNGQMQAVALDDFGELRSPVRTHGGNWNNDTPQRTAAWDGAHVVVVGQQVVGELDVNAELVATTPLSRPVFAAVGSRDGIVALVGDTGLASPPEVVVVTRGSGAFIVALGALPTTDSPITGGVAAYPNTVYFASSTYLDRDRIIWSRVGCEK